MVIQCEKFENRGRCEADPACYYKDNETKCFTNQCAFIDAGVTGLCEKNKGCKLDDSKSSCILKNDCDD
jgi:hypothetical protein